MDDYEYLVEVSYRGKFVSIKLTQETVDKGDKALGALLSAAIKHGLTDGSFKAPYLKRLPKPLKK